MKYIFLVAPFVMAILSGCTSTAPPDAARSGSQFDPGSIARPASSEYDTPPKLIVGAAPIYPINAMLSSRGGSVTIEFVISKDGTTREHKVVESDDDRAFANHVVIAVRAWKFSPAYKDGKPISVQTRQSFHFGTKR
jgi:TonB family protein